VGFLSKLRPDPRCYACNRIQAACICGTRREHKAVNRKAVAHGGKVVKPAPKRRK
jgi:DTW domain-containing protein YfiP